VLDNYLFVAGFRGVIIFDISNPAEPKSIGFYETIRFKGPAVTYVVNSMVGIDNFLFLGTSDGLLILDVSNPKKPFIIGSYKDFDVKNIYISNNYAYVTGEKSPYFYILDMTDKSKPFLVSKYDEALNPTVRIYIVGKTAYIIENVSTEKYVLKIFDVSDPAKIRLMGTYEEKWMLDVYVRDKFAYLATENGLSILDVSTPSQPIFIQKFSEEQGELFYRVSGIDNYIYSIVWSPTKFYTLRIFEIKD
jgi:hypothetical protein